MSRSRTSRAKRRQETAVESRVARLAPIRQAVRGERLDICSCGLAATRWFDIPNRGARSFCSGHLPQKPNCHDGLGLRTGVIVELSYGEAMVWMIMKS